jgi:predicted O-methyltransferase YrrM
MELLTGMLDNGEGNISWYPERQYTLVDLIRQHKPRNIIEIGVNAGHSTLLIVNTLVEIIEKDPGFNSEKIVIFLFDICKYECTEHNYLILKNYAKQYNIQIELFKGDSLDMVPRVLSNYPFNFDFVEIDGAHFRDYVLGDILNTYQKINDNGIIYIDDFNSSKDPTPDVNEVVTEFNWQGFHTYYIDGVFWAQKQSNNKNNMSQSKEHVNHPQHYGGESNPYEAIKVIDAWELNFALGNTVKYISRAGKKDPKKELEDLKKAMWYLQHHIQKLESSN